MLNINTNYASAFASNAANTASKGLDSAMEKLSTGSRINYAKDDAAGQAISTRLFAEIQGLAMASRNAADAQSLIDTAEGAMQETHTVLLRMRELAVQSANGTLTDADRQHTNAEFEQLQAEMDRIAANTTWAGQNLLDGYDGMPANPDDWDGTRHTSFTFQIGEGANQAITVEIENVNSWHPSETFDSIANDFVETRDGVNHNYDPAAPFASNSTHRADTNLLSAEEAQDAIISIDRAIDHVSMARGKLGAVSNRLDSTMSNLDQIAVNLSASQGRIQDADFAQETGNLAKNQILQQAATAMIAQANASKSSVLTLLR